MGKFWGNLLCMGLFLRFATIPTPRSLDRPYDGLPARMDVDMLDGHLLLALAAMVVEGVEQRGPRAGELVRLIEALAPSLEGLLGEHRPSIALHAALWAAISCAAIISSSSSVGAMLISAATVALYCLSRVLGSECFS